MTNIGELLIDAGLPRERLDECRRAAASSGETLDRVILQKGYLPEPQLLQVYAHALGFEYRESLDGLSVPSDFVNSVPVHFARNYNLVALPGSTQDVLKVATCAPLDPHPMDDLSSLVGREIDPVLAPRLEITTLIGRAYRHKADGVDEAIADVAEDGDFAHLAEEIDDAEDVLDVSNKAPIIKLVNTILFQALKMRASDVHFQSYADRMQVRFRIDGLLYNMDSIPRRVQDAIVSRVKIMGKMDIAERRLPQDGRATIKIGDGEVDVRISTVPTSSGERIVMRLLDKTAKLYTLNEIGLTAENEEMLREYLNYNHGIILVTGPTGSGKTTTLAGALSKLNAPGRKLISIEDPIEYQIEGVNQIAVNPAIGLTFAAVLRSVLRHDPDIIVVGELRDGETAEIAVNAALTGHLVLATVHTNTAAGAAPRLIDMGVDPALLRSTLRLAIAQRLVRMLCPDCKTPVEPPEGLSQAFEAKGCPSCDDTGYRGRSGVFEFIEIDGAISETLRDGVSSHEIEKKARKAGTPSILDDARAKIEAGLTSPSEVRRVLGDV
ncbi:MAG: Flp pilus assembly complex ATPase component TadA [Planctomycetes bacterium]|nr:Flp pilus assembly complex ATPase component TadA [Planctomycetota bacterium]